MNKVLIIESILNRDIVDILSTAAKNILEQNGVEYECIKVTGIFEIPAAVSIALDAFDYDGVVALGAQITSNNIMNDIIFKECIRGLNDISIHFSIPLGVGVLMVENQESILELANNFGSQAASSCMELIKIKSLYQTFYHDSTSGYKN